MRSLVSTGYWGWIRIESKGFWFEAVVIQVLQELQVSIDISWKFWRRRINRFVVTIAVSVTNQRWRWTGSVRESRWRSVVVDNNGVRDRGRNIHRGWSLNARDGFKLVKSWWETCKGCSDVCKKKKTRVSSKKKKSCIGGRICDQCWRLIWVVWDGGHLKGRQTHIKSKLDLRRWNQRSSISQVLKVFQRSQGMLVIFAKDDQRI